MGCCSQATWPRSTGQDLAHCLLSGLLGSQLGSLLRRLQGYLTNVELLRVTQGREGEGGHGGRDGGARKVRGRSDVGDWW